MKTELNEINEYFVKIRTDENYNDMLLIESMDISKKRKIYDYLKNNNALYAGGEMDVDDLHKVRNVMIKLWLKADKNNKRYGRKRATNN